MWSTTAGGQAWLWGCPPQSVPAHEASPGSLDREPPRTHSNPAKIHQGQPHLSHSGRVEWSPSQPVCRRFPDPSQVNLCPVSPLQGQEAFISSATPQPGPGAAPRGRGGPHSHSRCHSPALLLLSPRQSPHPRCGPPVSPAGQDPAPHAACGWAWREP